MRDQEPLEAWLFIVTWQQENPLPRASSAETRQQLHDLSMFLDAAAPGKVDYGKLRGGTITPYTTPFLTPAEALEAQRIFRTVWELGGAGQSYVQEGLLQVIALACTTESIPFWQQLLDLTRPRD